MATQKKDQAKRSPFLIFVFGAVVVSFTLSFFLGQSGILRLRQIRDDYDRLMMENFQLAVGNRDLRADIRNLKTDPATIEKIAREELHFVSPHDLVLVVPDEEESQ
jgi:cell division protein FtsB